MKPPDWFAAESVQAAPPLRSDIQICIITSAQSS